MWDVSTRLGTRPVLRDRFQYEEPVAQSNSSVGQLGRESSKAVPQGLLVVVQPDLNDYPVDREANPESHPEELPGAEMRQRACSKKQPHHRSGCCNTQQNDYGAYQ